MKATHEDVEMLVDMMLDMYYEAKPEDRPPVYVDVDYLTSNLHNMIENECCLLHCKPGGFILGWVAANPLYPIIEAQETLFYVEPAKRGSMLAYSLYKSYEAEAKSKGAISSCVGHATQINPEAAERFYKGMKYRQTGNIYEKDL